MRTDHIVGIDLGRHRVYVVHADETSSVLPMQADHQGLIFRWLGPGGAERVIDHVETLPDSQAQNVCSVTAQMITKRIATIDAKATSGSVALAMPVMPDGQICQRFVTGFKEAGMDTSITRVVARPIATLAYWLAERRENGHEGHGVVLAVDNNAGQISAVIADLAARRLLAVAQLTPGPHEPENAAARSLKVLVGRASHAAHQFPTTTTTANDLTSTLEDILIDTVLVSGSNTDHPSLTQLIETVGPETKIWGQGRADAEVIVAHGLTRLGHLDNWVCPWPTGYLLIDDEVILRPGPQPLLTDRVHAIAPAATYEVNDNAVIRLASPDGSAWFTRLNGEDGIGLRLPSRLGSKITVRSGTDGKVSLFGSQSARPLTIQPKWPAIATTTNAVPVGVINANTNN